ncbi:MULTISPECIES: CBS domain-containing protein [unclassified Methylophilus]|uniref:CBS domain-containing protein n=1 Tax=unclassified Methylophilus TaxID=2630143 RepID=UPI0006FC1663|nr:MULTISPECIES: CBS domain-containing protein [unclassified Methylophilus]KQT42422.1 inosine-5-monophosphate dehydrogenase [Methylophilus sp. Leaf416]KQT56605.1 inosine-5-monophosphate dehydrogenase [Methylophilus sp. Leaf459]
MLISQIMTPEVIVASPNDTLRSAARTMLEHDLGILPICENDELIGMLSDRDITIRAVARGLSLDDTRISQLLGTEARYVFDDQTVEEAAHEMKQFQIRRLPVLDRENQLVGIISLADIVMTDETAATEALAGISQPA